jgi:hypothetical protein
VATFAVINNGIVKNCIIADSLDIAQEVTGLTCVEYTNENAPSIGYLYDNGIFTNPNPQVETYQETTDIEAEQETTNNG